MHSFSSAARFSEHLVGLGSAPTLEDDRFPARNFGLESALPPERVTSYLPDGDLDLGSGPHRAQLSLWNQHHDRYLAAHVRAGWRGEDLDLTSATAPETFRLRSDLDEYGHTDDEVDLVRVESLSRIARSIEEAPNELRMLASDVAAERRSGGGVSSSGAAELDEHLREWHEARDLDNRPIFACFWHDAGNLLADPSDRWPTELRDRLGLLHYDPQQRLLPDGLDVIAFRYPVEIVHRSHRTVPRTIARPTVLDGALSRSFCTFPAGSGRGCALDLAASGDEPWQEVVHPAVRFEASHVWAVGAITDRVPLELELPRWLHYQAVRNSVDDDFATLIDQLEGDPA